MTVRFKCQTEYQKSFGVSRSRAASPHTLAGLRSDQMAFSREPCLQRRRRRRSAPGHGSSLLCPPDQMPPSAQRKVPPAASRSSSVQKKEPAVDSKLPADPGPPEELGPVPEAEPLSNPEPPSDLAKTRHHQPDSQPQPSSLDRQKPSATEVNLALWRKAGLMSRSQGSGGQMSEHHRQFSWKEPTLAVPPILTAEQGLSRLVPPFRKKHVSMDTEYQRSFQGLVLPTGPRLRKQLEHQRVPLSYTDMRKERSEKKLCPIQEKPAPQNENVRSRSPPRQATPTPTPPPPPPPQKVQHRLQEGGEAPDVQASQIQGFPTQSWSWLNEVQELRQKAVSYRRRAWGTNFCRDHLSQLQSDHNALWEPTDTPTHPPTPHLTSDPGQDAAAAPDSSSSSFVGALDLDSHSSNSSPRMSIGRTRDGGTAPTPPAERRQAWRRRGGNEGGGDGDEGDGGGETDEEGGRLPTPTLKIRPVQRTHHDRTTPATGGAILVGKLMSSSSPLLYTPQPQRPVSAVSMAQRAHTADDVPVTKKEAWPEQIPVPIPSSNPSPIKSTASAACKPIRTKHSPPPPVAPAPHHCIHGTLRHPDFQHNGHLGLRSRDYLWSGGDFSLDEDDRLSVMSWRSAASCSMASSVLERAQKRQQDFWGKS
ncbi:nuclear protein MDM1 [Genypterus blacodes]|uniref:nuclear protein MDM1 n=1 Tax=Genypterus blacodes TaxID=154954 RepID=UPI003F76ABE8